MNKFIENNEAKLLQIKYPNVTKMLLISIVNEKSIGF